MFSVCLCGRVFFDKGYSQVFVLVSCPKQGTVLRTQNLKRVPTAAGGAVKADRSGSEERLVQHEPPDRCCFLSATLAAFTSWWPVGLQL